LSSVVKKSISDLNILERFGIFVLAVGIEIFKGNVCSLGLIALRNCHFRRPAAVKNGI